MKFKRKTKHKKSKETSYSVELNKFKCRQQTRNKKKGYLFGLATRVGDKNEIVYL